jgi:hypothetical protein
LEQSEAWLRIHPMIVDFVSVDAVEAANGVAAGAKANAGEGEQSAVDAVTSGGGDHVS